MSIRHWVFATALGLALPALGQEQSDAPLDEQPSAESDQEEANTTGDEDRRGQQTEAIDLGPSFEGIESAIRDLIPEPNDAERNRQIEQQRRDLDAQEAMARWAFWMFVAAALTVALTFLALVAIVRTLVHTKRAADSAEGMLNEASATTAAANETILVARQMGLAEQRPYVQAQMGGPISHWDEKNENAIFWRIKILLTNTGNTPTRNLMVRSCWRIVSDELFEMPSDVKPISCYIRGHDRISPLTISVSGVDLAAVRRGEKQLYVFVETTYGTALDEKALFLSRQGFRATNIMGDPTIYWDEKNPVGIDWAYVPSFHCFDEECEANS